MFTSQLLFFGLGAQEILIIALVVLLLFGGKKIPELMKGLGRGVKSFKEGLNEVDETVSGAVNEANKVTPDDAVVKEEKPKKDE